MQRYENTDTVDTRPIKVIWAQMSENERDGIRYKIKNKLKRTPQTIWNWIQGNTCPESSIERAELVRIFKSAGYNVIPETFFGDKR